MQNFPWSREDVELVKALYADDGGRRALEFIIERLGNLNGLSFAGDPHVTAFNEGRRFVATELLAAINIPTDRLVSEAPNGRTRVITATERAEHAATNRHYSALGRRSR